MSKTSQSEELLVIERNGARYTMTAHMQEAERLIAALHALTTAIPGFDDDGMPTDAAVRLVRRKVGVPPQFMRESLAALIGSTPLEIVRQLDDGASVDLAEYLQAYRPLKQAMRVASRRLDFVLKLKEAELISRLQKIFGIVKAMALDSNDTTLVEIVRVLRNARRRPRRKFRARKPKKT